jgi:DNA-binding IscR family transcriptional regulator
VIRALEGPLVLGSANEREEEGVVGVTEAVFRDLSERVESCFDEVSLADICERAQRMGLPRASKETYSYVI